MLRVTGEDRGGAAGRGGARRRWPRLLLVVPALLTLLGLALGFDFLRFATSVARAVPPADARADGIVVLTGGAERISSGLTLLADGRANRMLISGVDRRTDDAALLRAWPDAQALHRCCIDLGREAIDTVGNAEEARKWAAANHFHSLMVVTSAYHIPRSLAELGDAMPDRELIAYPVARPELDLDGWYRRPDTTRLLAAEYVKYLVVRVRLALERAGIGSPPPQGAPSSD